MTETLSTLQLHLEPDDNERLASLCGQFDEHLRQVERRLGVEIANRGNDFTLIGADRATEAAALAVDPFDAVGPIGPVGVAAQPVSCTHGRGTAGKRSPQRARVYRRFFVGGPGPADHRWSATSRAHTERSAWRRRDDRLYGLSRQAQGPTPIDPELV